MLKNIIYAILMIPLIAWALQYVYVVRRDGAESYGGAMGRSPLVLTEVTVVTNTRQAPADNGAAVKKVSSSRDEVELKKRAKK